MGSAAIVSGNAHQPENVAKNTANEHSSNRVHRAADAKCPEGAPTQSTGGLAVRRRMISGLMVRTKEKDTYDPNKIKVVKDVKAFYKLGKEVMPSTHKGREVIFATRISDGKEVVIKTRKKLGSGYNTFTCKSDEQEWRQSTELLLSLAACDNIAQLHEVLEDSTTYYIVMEKVKGVDLFELLQTEKRLPISKVKAILRQLLRAVQELHASGCIHKDLKLENVMIDKTPSPRSPVHTPKGQAFENSPSPTQPSIEPPSVVKLIDFDTVQTFAPEARANCVIGTDQYIAPEAYAGHYSPTSDIFAIGVIAYRLIAGKFPFTHTIFDDGPGENWVGSPKMQVIQEKLKAFPIDFSAAPWPAEPEARELVGWMLASDEKERPTAQQCIQHIFFELSGETPGLPQGPWGSRTKRDP